MEVLRSQALQGISSNAAPVLTMFDVAGIEGPAAETRLNRNNWGAETGTEGHP